MMELVSAIGTEITYVASQVGGVAAELPQDFQEAFTARPEAAPTEKLDHTPSFSPVGTSGPRFG